MSTLLATVVLTVAGTVVVAGAQPGPGMGPGRGPGMGPGMGRGMGHGGPPADASRAADQQTFHYLVDHRAEITRKVIRLSDGVETLTESDDPEVAAAIQRHVQAMHARLLEGRPIHRRDPLFAELFRHGKDIDMKLEPTKTGMRVVETSKDPWVVALIQEHAKVVSAFLANGYDEVRRNHPLPPRPPGSVSAPPAS